LQQLILLHCKWHVFLLDSKCLKFYYILLMFDYSLEICDIRNIYVWLKLTLKVWLDYRVEMNFSQILLLYFVMW